MAITTVTSRDFARDLANAKRAAEAGPVIVTDRGRPAYALLRIDEYYRLAGPPAQSLLALMDTIEGGTGEFEPPCLSGEVRPAEFG